MLAAMPQQETAQVESVSVKVGDRVEKKIVMDILSQKCSY